MIFDRLLLNYYLHEGWYYVGLTETEDGDYYEKTFLIKKAIRYFEKALKYDFESKLEVKDELRSLYKELEYYAYW